MKYIISASFLLVSLYACQSIQKENINEEKISSETDIKSKRYIDFIKYLSNTFTYVPSKKESKRIFCVLPLDGCNSCLESSISLIRNNISDDMIIIVVTRWKKNIEKFKLNDLKIQENSLWWDSREEAFGYDFGLGYPLIFYLENGEYIFSYEMNEIEYPKIKKQLSWN
jgi:hypothetical protein